MKKLHQLTGELEPPSEVIALMNNIQWTRNSLDFLCERIGNDQLDGCIVIAFNGDAEPEIRLFGKINRRDSLFAAEIIRSRSMDTDDES